MSLTSGHRLGPYEIIASLGAGGMGEVYRARDSRLGRDVAVKVLPGHLAVDLDFRERFEREARAVARLSHPNILALYDVGESDGVRFIVTELVDGEPIKGPLPLRKLLDVAAQIASGLAAAHEAGVVHRDVKPDNILIGRDGRVKILDFGLAREHAAAEDGPGVTRAATAVGTVLGTLAYMSPEQARGILADARSDQFSFGLVLYELASGRQAFARESAVQTLAAIMDAEPDLAPLATVPAPLRWIIERCLVKDPADRYASTADLYRDLRQLRDRQSELGRPGAQDVVVPPAKPRRLWLALAVPALVAVVAAGTFIWSRQPGSPSIDAHRFVPFAVDAGVESMPAWSPDGQGLAFSGEVDGYYQIFTRRLDQSTASRITNLPGDCLYPAWDTAGTRVFFQVENGDGRRARPEVWVVSAAGGAPERLVTGASAFAVAPDGNSLVLLARQAADVDEGPYVLRAFDLKSRSSRDLNVAPFSWYGPFTPNGRGLRFAPDGSVLGIIAYGSSDLMLLPNPLSTTGAVSRTVHFAPVGGEGVSLYEFDWMPDSRHAALVLRDRLGGDPSIWLGDIGSGAVARLTASPQWESTPAVSPDGARIAFSSTPLDWDLLEIDLGAGVTRPLIASSRYDGWGDWMPDGSGLVFSTQRTGRFEIWTQAFRDSVSRAVVTPDAFPREPSLFLVQGRVSPDGRSLAYVRYAQAGTSVYVSALAGSRPVALTSEPAAGARDVGPTWSPDGRWILFGRDRSVMKALASGGTTPTTIAQDLDMSRVSDGPRAHWLPDGRGIIYSAVDGLRQIAIDGGPTRRISQAKPLTWDVAPDGRAIYGILERERRMMDLVTIDVTTGAERTLLSLGRKPLTPDYSGYSDTVRALRVSPDGKRLMFARLNPSADIWILEGIGGR